MRLHKFAGRPSTIGYLSSWVCVQCGYEHFSVLEPDFNIEGIWMNEGIKEISYLDCEEHEIVALLQE